MLVGENAHLLAKHWHCTEPVSASWVGQAGWAGKPTLPPRTTMRLKRCPRMALPPHCLVTGRCVISGMAALNSSSRRLAVAVTHTPRFLYHLFLSLDGGTTLSGCRHRASVCTCIPRSTSLYPRFSRHAPAFGMPRYLQAGGAGLGAGAATSLRWRRVRILLAIWRGLRAMATLSRAYAHEGGGEGEKEEKREASGGEGRE